MAEDGEDEERCGDKQVGSSLTRHAEGQVTTELLGDASSRYGSVGQFRIVTVYSAQPEMG